MGVTELEEDWNDGKGRYVPQPLPSEKISLKVKCFKICHERLCVRCGVAIEAKHITTLPSVSCHVLAYSSHSHSL